MLASYRVCEYIGDGRRADGAYQICRFSRPGKRLQTRDTRNRIAKGLANHRVGVVLLARLAADVTEKGKGLEKALLFDALKRIEGAADIIAVRAVIVHAIDDQARRFCEHFNFDRSPIDPFQLMLLLKDIRKALR